MLVRFEYDNGGFERLAKKIQNEWPDRHKSLDEARAWLRQWLTKKFVSMPLATLRAVELEIPFQGTLAVPVFHDVSDGTGLLQVRFAEFMREGNPNEMVEFGEADPGDDPVGYVPAAVLMKHPKN